MNTLLCIGMGFSALALARHLDRSDWRIVGTSTTVDGVERLKAMGIDAVRFDGSRAIDAAALAAATHLLVSAPPGADGDPAFRSSLDPLRKAARSIRWAAYLSTTGVYGDRAGEWVDETSALTPTNERSKWRVAAEQGWLSLHQHHGLPIGVFRLAGIYGPGRNQIRSLLDGTARRIVKPGQLFSRIHVDDIAGALLASMGKIEGGEVFNVCDDEPAPPQDVIVYAAELLGIAPPPAEAFATAQLSPMARSFYNDSKRVSNAKLKAELAYHFRYPTYREGLQALLPLERASA